VEQPKPIFNCNSVALWKSRRRIEIVEMIVATLLPRSNAKNPLNLTQFVRWLIAATAQIYVYIYIIYIFLYFIRNHVVRQSISYSPTWPIFNLCCV